MILIDLKKTTDNIREKFNNKDLVSLDDLLDEFDSLLEESKKETEENDYNPELEIPDIHGENISW